MDAPVGAETSLLPPVLTGPAERNFKMGVGGDTASLKQRFGDRIAFWGAIDTGHILPYGTLQDVHNEVRRRVNDLAPGGGYVLASVHNIQADVLPENICAIWEAADAL